MPPSELPARTWGGRRVGAGRPKTGLCEDEPHRERPEVRSDEVQHVVLRAAAGHPSLRSPRAVATIARALRIALGHADFRIVHVSIQRDHIHLLIEADSKDAFSRGMRSLTIAAARGLNKVLDRSGKVFPHRYHHTPVATPTQMHLALSYVLNNWRRHDEAEAGATFDPCSTARHFDGWREPLPAPAHDELLPSATPQSALLIDGWRRLGKISAYDVPKKL
ncbi:MAG TPA: transposase [Kofleriaceae bacterium]|nr:transposase [Kofleriaceae bacterium]